MKPYNIYFLNLIFHIIYVILSFFICWTIFLNYIEVLFLFEVLPVLSFLIQKRFISTYLTQLFNLVLSFSTVLSLLFIFPLICYYIKSFFITSWYKYQIHLFSLGTKSFFNFFLTFYILIHFSLIFYLTSFFLYWEILDEYSLLRVETELVLALYISWIFTFKFFLSLLFGLIGFLFSLIFYFTCIYSLYFIILVYKKLFIFLILLILFFFLPPDFFSQFFLTFFLCCFVEFLFLISCIKLFILLKNKILNNAYFKTIT